MNKSIQSAMMRTKYSAGEAVPVKNAVGGARAERAKLKAWFDKHETVKVSAWKRRKK